MYSNVREKIPMDSTIPIRPTIVLVTYMDINLYYDVILKMPCSFCDTKSVITSSTLPHSLLHKRYNALSYHRVCETIAAGLLRFIHISGLKNPADVFSKHCGYPQLMPLTRPTILFWKDEPSDIPSCHVESGSVTDHKPGPEFLLNSGLNSGLDSEPGQTRTGHVRVPDGHKPGLTRAMHVWVPIGHKPG